MALTPRLDLRQSQSLVMTPQLQQAIKLLQFSNLELAEYVESELEQNPLLERDEGIPDDAGPSSEPEVRIDEALEPTDRAMGDDSRSTGDKELDVDYDNVWNHDSPGESAGMSDPAFAQWSARTGSFDGGEADLEQTVSGKVSLRDHLLQQLAIDVTDPIDRVIGVHLIDLLDETGYVTSDLAPVAERLECGIERVEQALERLQQFDPPGIFARSLAECLALQLRDRDRLDPAMQALLAHLDLLARRDVPALLKACGVDTEDLGEMVAEIRALDPKPALAFDSPLAQPVTPDILMRPHPSGSWIVELNAETLPRVLVNHPYYALVSKSARNKEEKQYLSERFQSANWLVKSLDQRANTILKVASEIVRQQDLFFAKGVRFLRPLVLRDIAEAIEMHESTVSRVTSNKYMATPRGIYELKYFFTPALANTSGGAAHSAESVRHRIKALVDAETKDTVLSDDGIVDILNREGIDIARRTVAKYREAMGIASSVQRRREKAVRL